MAEHTPGPWKHVQANCLDNEDDNRQSVVTVGPREYFVATIENGAPGDTLETEVANARLIAAAPDLLAIAKRIAAAAFFDEGTPLGRDARAAIDKAEGRQDTGGSG